MATKQTDEHHDINTTWPPLYSSSGHSRPGRSQHWIHRRKENLPILKFGRGIGQHLKIDRCAVKPTTKVAGIIRLEIYNHRYHSASFCWVIPIYFALVIYIYFETCLILFVLRNTYQRSILTTKSPFIGPPDSCTYACNIHSVARPILNLVG